ncbi:MAG: type II restriction endonuclease [Euryarchaeota archaeon]|nr:type II restriction endonuclease [Euryarchaeota archaeon]
MKNHPAIQRTLGLNEPAQVFEYLMKTRVDTITGWDYFVNWTKVLANTHEIEMDLNTLNYLVGKPNPEEALRELLARHPGIARTIPVLVASREREFKILTKIDGGVPTYDEFSFGQKAALSSEEIDSIVTFASRTGFLRLLGNKSIKSIVDYVIGIEAGLDSNARKNRSGDAMEMLVGGILKPICARHRLDFLEQATSKMIGDSWGLKVSVDKTSREFDFAVRSGSRLFLFEVNHYGGGGSKLKATAGEYQTLQRHVSQDGHTFVWITDGKGWDETRAPLEEAFHKIDFILNIRMASSGLLEEILTSS